MEKYYSYGDWAKHVQPFLKYSIYVSTYKPLTSAPPPPRIDFNCYARLKNYEDYSHVSCDYFKDGKQIITKRKTVSYKSNAKELNMYGDMPYPIELNIAVE